MGTKVMVRATRSFNGRVEGDWYWVDPDNPHEAALIRGGYLEHQTDLFEGLALEAVAAVEYPAEEWVLAGSLPGREGKGRGEVAAEPGEHPQDVPAEGPGAGDPDRTAGTGRRKKDRT